MTKQKQSPFTNADLGAFRLMREFHFDLQNAASERDLHRRLEMLDWQADDINNRPTSHLAKRKRHSEFNVHRATPIKLCTPDAVLEAIVEGHDLADLKLDAGTLKALHPLEQQEEIIEASENSAVGAR